MNLDTWFTALLVLFLWLLDILSLESKVFVIDAAVDNKSSKSSK